MRRDSKTSVSGSKMTQHTILHKVDYCARGCSSCRALASLATKKTTGASFKSDFKGVLPPPSVRFTRLVHGFSLWHPPCVRPFRFLVMFFGIGCELPRCACGPVILFKSAVRGGWGCRSRALFSGGSVLSVIVVHSLLCSSHVLCGTGGSARAQLKLLRVQHCIL